MLDSITSFFLILLLLFSLCFVSSTAPPLTEAQVSFIARRQLASLPPDGDLPADFENQVQIDPNLSFPNARLKRAYIALQAIKQAIHTDPLKTTDNWVGCEVCSYNGVFCAPAPDDPTVEVVAGIDLNHADIAAHFPVEIGLLTDLSLLHLNSNSFCGILPNSFHRLKLLFELDISNNRLSGPFPEPVLSLTCLKYLDVRFNCFAGELPAALFAMELDALFLNNNEFESSVNDEMGRSTVSVIVLANNKFTGCIPSTIGNMPNLNEIVMKNSGLVGCLPIDMGSMRNLTVLDISDNNFTGILPKSMSSLECAEAIDISNNQLTGFVPETVCRLPKLTDFAFSGNYFNGEAAPACHPDQRKEVALNDRDNCLPERPNQKSPEECRKVVGKPVECSKAICTRGGGPSKPVIPSPRPSPELQSPPPPEAESPPPPPPEVEASSPESGSSFAGGGGMFSAGGGGSIFSSVGGEKSASATGGSVSTSFNSGFSAGAGVSAGAGGFGGAGDYDTGS